MACEKFSCVRVFACLFFLFYCLARCGSCVLNSFVVGYSH
ncbi:putative membrane protein [Helicobacter pylori CPY3281]|nr:putative membrane protein [Helicobacter pylori CPY3281]